MPCFESMLANRLVYLTSGIPNGGFDTGKTKAFSFKLKRAFFIKDHEIKDR